MTHQATGAYGSNGELSADCGAGAELVTAHREVMSLVLYRGDVNEWGRQQCVLMLGTYLLASMWLPKDESDGFLASRLLHQFGKSGEGRWDQ